MGGTLWHDFEFRLKWLTFNLFNKIIRYRNQMATLTKYDSFEALKANSGTAPENLAASDERHEAFKQFVALLQAQVNKREPALKKKNAEKHN
jgi:hypothetical protein